MAFDRDIYYTPVVPQMDSSVMILRMINDIRKYPSPLFFSFSADCPSKYPYT